MNRDQIIATALGFPHPKVQWTDRPVERLCRHVYSPQELGELGGELARSIGEKRQLDADKKRAVAEFGAQMKACDAAIELAQGKLAAGYETRSVPCYVALNYPTAGRKTYFRTDTGAPAGEGEMTSSDSQFVLDLEDKAAAAVEAAAAGPAAGDGLVSVAAAVDQAVAQTVTEQAVAEAVDESLRETAAELRPEGNGDVADLVDSMVANPPPPADDEGERTPPGSAVPYTEEAPPAR